MESNQNGGGAFGFGDAEEDMDAMEAELMNADEEESKVGPKAIKLRVYINMDEDDVDKEGKKVDLHRLFVREDSSLPFYIDVSQLSL